MPKLKLTLAIHTFMVLLGQFISCTAKLFILMLPGYFYLIVGIATIVLVLAFLTLWLFATEYLPLEFMVFPFKKYLIPLIGCGLAGFFMGFFAL